MLAGCVQCGASNLPEEAFDMLPKGGIAEIHLAEGFQNIIFHKLKVVGTRRYVQENVKPLLIKHDIRLP